MRVVPLSDVGLVTVAEAAAYHGVTVEAVRRWVRLDYLPVVVVSGGTSTPRHLLRAADVEAFTPRKAGRPAKPRPARKPRRESR